MREGGEADAGRIKERVGGGEGGGREVRAEIGFCSQQCGALSAGK